jgi:hypothetical protein
MFKSALLAWTLTVLTSSLFAQNLEFGLLGGGAFYNGDIDVELNGALHTVRPAFGVYSRYFLNEYIAVRGQALFAQFQADEQRFPTQAWREMRGFSFKTQVFEAAVLPELRVLKWGNLDFYGFGGFGVSVFDAMTDYNEESPNMKNYQAQIQTELTAKIEKMALVMPIGGGVQWNINGKTGIGAEVSGRKTFSDGFDGIRHSGGTSNDFYFTANITFSTFLDWNPMRRTLFGMSGRRAQKRHGLSCPWF